MEFKKLSFLQKFILKKKNFRGYQDYKLLSQLSQLPKLDMNLHFDQAIHFKHSGNAGDIIYALPTIYSIAQSNPIHLLLKKDVAVIYNDGMYHPNGNVMLTEKTIELLKPLLLYQDKITSCEIFKNEKVNVDLDLFRNYPLFRGQGNLARWYFHIFGTNADLSVPWLSAPKISGFEQTIVIARSHRYRNPGIDFGFLSKHEHLFFLGLPEEYENMRKMLPHLKYNPVKDFLEMASIINSCKLFIGNQSFPFSIAEALKVKRILEVCYYCPNVNVEGKNGYDFCYQEPFERVVSMALND
jgi:hypothetical protein